MSIFEQFVDEEIEAVCAELRALLEPVTGFDVPHDRIKALRADVIHAEEHQGLYNATELLMALRGRVNRLVQRHCGVMAFEWVSYRGNCRHDERHGAQFFWAELAEDEGPGCMPGCDCWARPILPELARLPVVAPEPSRTEDWLHDYVYEVERDAAAAAAEQAYEILERFGLAGHNTTVRSDARTYARLRHLRRNKIMTLLDELRLQRLEAKITGHCDGVVTLHPQRRRLRRALQGFSQAVDGAADRAYAQTLEEGGADLSELREMLERKIQKDISLMPEDLDLEAQARLTRMVADAPSAQIYEFPSRELL